MKIQSQPLSCTFFLFFLHFYIQYIHDNSFTLQDITHTILAFSYLDIYIYLCIELLCTSSKHQNTRRSFQLPLQYTHIYMWPFAMTFYCANVQLFLIYKMAIYVGQLYVGREYLFALQYIYLLTSQYQSRSITI